MDAATEINPPGIAYEAQVMKKFDGCVQFGVALDTTTKLTAQINSTHSVDGKFPYHIRGIVQKEGKSSTDPSQKIYLDIVLGGNNTTFRRVELPNTLTSEQLDSVINMTLSLPDDVEALLKKTPPISIIPPTNGEDPFIAQKRDYALFVKAFESPDLLKKILSADESFGKLKYIVSHSRVMVPGSV